MDKIDSQADENTNEHRKSVLVLLILVAIIGAIIFFPSSSDTTDNTQIQPAYNDPQSPTPSQQPTEVVNSNPKLIVPDVVASTFSVSDDDLVYGSRGANIFIIEYSDFQCPFCQRFHKTAEQIVDESAGEIAWVYRHNAIPTHTYAKESSLVSECVHSYKGNDTFWEFADEAFRNQSSISPSYLRTLASKYGVSSSQVSDCVAFGSKENSVVELHSNQARKLGFNGTPNGIIINFANQKFESLPGALPRNDLEQIINAVRQ